MREITEYFVVKRFKEAPRWGAMTKEGRKTKSSFPEIPINLYPRGRR